jgi:hypothetical protein
MLSSVGTLGIPKFHAESAIDAVVGIERLKLIRAGVAQVHLVRTARVIARVVERARQLGQAFIDDGLRHAFIAPAPHHDRRMMTEAQNAVARILQKQRGSWASRL